MRRAWVSAVSLLAASACAGDEAADSDPSRFYIATVEPADGAVADVELAVVQLAMTGIPDLNWCTTRTMRVDAARDDGTLAFPVPVDVVLAGSGYVKLRPLSPYLHGWTYAVTVRGGETGCANEAGVPIEPFLSHFEVP